MYIYIYIYTCVGMLRGVYMQAAEVILGDRLLLLQVGQLSEGETDSNGEGHPICFYGGDSLCLFLYPLHPLALSSICCLIYPYA